MHTPGPPAAPSGGSLWKLNPIHLVVLIMQATAHEWMEAAWKKLNKYTPQKSPNVTKMVGKEWLFSVLEIPFWAFTCKVTCKGDWGIQITHTITHISVNLFVHTSVSWPTPHVNNTMKNVYCSKWKRSSNAFLLWNMLFGEDRWLIKACNKNKNLTCVFTADVSDSWALELVAVHVDE